MKRHGWRLAVLAGLLLGCVVPESHAAGFNFWRRKKLEAEAREPGTRVRFNPWADENMGEDPYTIVRDDTPAKAGSRAATPVRTLVPDGGPTELAPEYARGNAGRPLAWISQRWNMRVTIAMNSDRLTLSGDTCTVHLIPGMREVEINGRSHVLSREVTYVDGVLMIPGDLLRLLPEPPPPARGDFVVVLDPGHGGKDPGAIGHGGIREKDVTLKIAQYTRAMLVERGIAVRMTRTGDTYPSLAGRADLANRTPNGVFVSIHANAATDSSVRGIETFVLTDGISTRARASAASNQYGPASGRALPFVRTVAQVNTTTATARSQNFALANAIHQRLSVATRDEDRGVRKANYHVLRESYFAPAALVEVGFLTHPQTAAKLRNDAHLRSIARSIADGLCDYARRQRPVGTTLAATSAFSHKAD